MAADEYRAGARPNLRRARKEVLCDARALLAQMATVDALARLQLEAHRCGCRITLSGCSAELGALIDLAGLGDVLPGTTGGASFGP